MRHGHSLANEKGIILSDPAEGVRNYGLSETGKIQAENAARSFTAEGKCVICSSDFLRTAETARIAGQILCIEDILFTEKLRERFFGRYEGLDNSCYEKVWAKDRDDDNNSSMGVESPASVAERTASLLEDLESRYENCNIILVSHGDCLQIMQTVFEGLPPRAHRSLPHLETAEIREVS